MTDAVGLMENLATASYEWLALAHSLEARLGEETITDILLMELKRQLPGRMHIRHTSKLEESRKGCDWEWWIGGSKGWVRFAVQAKKLDYERQRYTGFRQTVGAQFQYDILSNYATTHCAAPIYCLYNSPSPSPLEPVSWHCGQPYEPTQFGCTVVAPETVKSAAAPYVQKTFRLVHQPATSLPWRCLLKCPRLVSVYGTEPKGTECAAAQGRRDLAERMSRALYRFLPNEVAALIGQQPPVGRNAETPNEKTYPARTDGLRPSRVCVMEVEPTPVRG